jgi:hypothetical protein
MFDSDEENDDTSTYGETSYTAKFELMATVEDDEEEKAFALILKNRKDQEDNSSDVAEDAMGAAENASEDQDAQNAWPDEASRSLDFRDNQEPVEGGKVKRERKQTERFKPKHGANPSHHCVCASGFLGLSILLPGFFAIGMLIVYSSCVPLNRIMKRTWTRPHHFCTTQASKQASI